MRLIKLIVLTIALAWSCLNGWSQNDSIHPLRGNDTVVTVRIDLIRKANIKLIEHRHCPEIIATKDTIINLERMKYTTMDSIYRAAYRDAYVRTQVLEKQIAKTKRRNKILGGTTIGSVAIVVLTLLLK